MTETWSCNKQYMVDILVRYMSNLGPRGGGGGHQISKFPKFKIVYISLFLWSASLRLKKGKFPKSKSIKSCLLGSFLYDGFIFLMPKAKMQVPELKMSVPEVK